MSAVATDVTARRPTRRAARAAQPPPAGEWVIPLVPALLLSALSGWVLSLAFPSANVWVLAFVGVAGLLAALHGRRGFWSGALVGLVGALAFWFELIGWVTLFLGPVPLLALGSLEAIIMAVGAGLIAVTYRAVPRVWPSRVGRLGIAPLVVAATWVGREAVGGTFPYGGFAWGRVSESQSTSPFAPLAAWLGLAGLSFVLVWLTAFALACLTEPRAALAEPIAAGEWLPRLLPRLTAVTLAVLAVLAVPAFPVQVTDGLRVAAVQANTRSGYFQRTEYAGQILDQNVAASLKLVGRGAELVVWPEGASDISPLTDATVQQRWNTVAAVTGAPLLAGAITERGGRLYNSSLLWQPGTGVTEVYDKVHPVPFGEYVPDRAFWTPFAPSLIGLVGRDYTPGTRSPLMRVHGARVGVDICFDIVDDGLIVGSVRDGAEVLVAQTNNADFGRTEESEQQLAIARLRAIETGRSVVSVSTVAATAAIAPDGVTIAALPSFRAGTLVTTVPLSTTVTPAVAFGLPLGVTIALLGGLLPLVAALLAGRAARAQDALRSLPRRARR
jgi:apolipoprotein N-acyltransferase